MKILHITLTILIIAILPFIVFTLITSKSSIIAGIQSFVVLTGSMQPAIPAGSIVYTRKTRLSARQAQNYEKGDVITFRHGNVIVTHRIYAKIAKVNEKNAKEVFYQTKGDANKTVDQGLTAQKDILGKSIFYVPFIGRLVLFLKTFPGYALLIIFPTAFFIVFELNNIRKEIIKQAEKKAMEKMQTA